MNLFPINPTQVDAVWPAIESLIDDACKTSRGRFRPEYWQEFCKTAGKLWIVTDRMDQVRAAGISMVHNQGARQICRMRVIAGEGLKDWVGHISDIELWAKRNGCDGMEIVGGKGWERVMKPYGYDLTHVVLEKDLFDG